MRYQVKIEYRYRRQRQCANVVGVHDTVLVNLINVCRSDSSPMVMVVHMAGICVGVGVNFDLLEAGGNDP
jgi:hypothetical protein